MKISEIIRLLENDGWRIKRVTGSHRHYSHPAKPGLVTVAGKPQRYVKAEDRSKHPAASGPAEGATVRGYVVVFEGDDEAGYSAYSPDLPGVVAAGSTHQETERLMREAMAEHIAVLRQEGRPVPEPADAESVTILDPAAA